MQNTVFIESRAKLSKAEANIQMARDQIQAARLLMPEADPRGPIADRLLRCIGSIAYDLRTVRKTPEVILLTKSMDIERWENAIYDRDAVEYEQIQAARARQAAEAVEGGYLPACGE